MSPSALELVLPDGSIRSVEPGTTAFDIAADIGPGLAKAAVGGVLNERYIDLREPILEAGDFRIVTLKSPEAGDFIRHSAEHVMADAVQRLWPGTEIDAGRRDHSEKFQYDFRFPRAFTAEDLEQIEAQMQEIMAEDAEFERIEISRDEAIELFTEMGESLKVERIKDIPGDDVITLFRHGRFTDLCRGPHVQRAGQVGAAKLLEASSVYWKGDENNERLERIFGTAFGSKKELAAYVEQAAEALKRDHRRLGPELDLFSFHPSAPASPFFHPKGATIYNELVDFVRELYVTYRYCEVATPQILDVELWKKSGHYDNYREAMFFTEVDEKQFAVKPMNCPTHCLIFGTRRRSYRDLPIRYSDFGRLHRYERSGVITGLTRVRSFCQDDAHIFCTDEQIEDEVIGAVEMIQHVYETFGFDNVQIEVSTRPEKSLGTQEMWDRAESALMGALERRDIPYEINPGDGSFYGPKIDFQVRDAIGRSWQLGTVQLDYQMPERFGLAYVGADGDDHRPVMIHRAMLGSIERFLGILIEHTSGAFPLWLAPVQATILPVSEKFLDYARAVAEKIQAAGLRVEVDTRNEKLGYKIREAQLQKVPYMLVVGAREAEDEKVNVRRRSGDELGEMTAEDFAAHALALASSRSNEL